MSKSILMDLLRIDLGYNGVIISDDITMGAILENYSIELASLNFLKAGGDIVLICHGEDNPIAVIQFIKDSINNGNIRVEDIDEKVYRILALKEKYNLEDNIIDSIDLENINKQTEELRKKILQ
jgi:beta-N-acetylhexosaminidase